MKILNLGSLNIDKTYQVQHFVQPKETMNALGYDEHCGGKGLNQSVALARAGAEVYHAGMVGQDGEELLRVLNQAGVRTQFIEKMDMPSGHAVIQVDAQGQNSIIIFGGANQSVTQKYIDTVFKTFGEGDILLLQNEVSNIDYAIEKAKSLGIKIAFNPSPFNEKILKCNLDLVDYFIVNEIEGKLLADSETFEPQEIIAKLKGRYPNAGFVVTFGENGSYYFDSMEQIYQPVFAVTTVDTTGAGDTYCGYFLAGLSKEMPIKENLKFASAASALAVAGKGAADSIPSLEAVEKFIEKGFEC